MQLNIILLSLVLLLFPDEKQLNVVPIDKEHLHTIIQNRNNKILFLNIWATWCKPCVEEFPDIIKLAEEYKKNGNSVEFIAVSADYSDEIETLILPFLKKLQPIPFNVYVADFQSQDKFISSLDQNWSGAIPATFIYDISGKQKAFLIGQHTYKQFKEEIEKVLHIQ